MKEATRQALIRGGFDPETFKRKHRRCPACKSLGCGNAIGGEITELRKRVDGTYTVYTRMDSAAACAVRGRAIEIALAMRDKRVPAKTV